MQLINVKIIEIILVYSLFLKTLCIKSQEDDDLLVEKRSLVEREQAFLKSQPMSEDLKSFITQNRHKKEVEITNPKDNRKKRSGAGKINENVLYAIQDGQLVPFKGVDGFQKSEEKRKSDTESYTVVPLVIPTNGKIPVGKLIQTRNLENAAPVELAKSEAPPLPPISTPLNVVQVTGKANVTGVESGGGEGEETNDNQNQEDTVVLHKILEDVEGLMHSKHEGNKKEGVLCNLNGSWISEAAGMRFDISYKNSTRKKFRIHVADRIPPNEDGFLCDGNWTVFGELPFLHSGMVIALAVHSKDKHLATFIGECRTCEGSETVTGTWLIGRSSRDCKDQKAAHKILSDIWRREQAHTLRKKHLEKIGYTEKYEEE